MRPYRCGAATQIHGPGEAPNIRKGRPDRAIEVIELHVGRDETITAIEANRGTDKGAINIDDMGLQHDESTFGGQSEKRVDGRTCGEVSAPHRPGTHAPGTHESADRGH